MWLDNLKEIKKLKGNPSYKAIADGTNLPERTIARIFMGDTAHPYVDTLHRITTFFGVSLDDILADSKTVVIDKESVKSQEETAMIVAERDLVVAENTILKDKVAVLTAENDLLKIKLEHKDEIIALHNYYNKMELSDR